MKSDEKTLRKYYMDKDYSFPSSCPANFNQTHAVRKSERQHTHMKMQKKEEVLENMIHTARKVYDGICKKDGEIRKKQIKSLWQENLTFVDETNKNAIPSDATWSLKKGEDFDGKGRYELNNVQLNCCVNYTSIEMFRGEIEDCKGKKQLTPIITIPALAPIPPVLDWTSIPFNIQVEDGKYLTNIPFLGDHVIERDLRFLDAVVGHYKGKIHQEHHETKNVLEDDHFIAIVSKITEANKIRTRNQTKESDDLTEEGEISNNSQAAAPQIATSSKREVVQLSEIEVDEKSVKMEMHSNPPAMVYSAISKAFKGIGTEIELKQRYESLLRKHSISEVPLNNAKITPSPVPNIDGVSSKSLPRESSLCSYHSLFCRRCYKYDCQQHAEEDHVASKFLKKTPAALEQVFGECQTENCWRKKELCSERTKSRQQIRKEWAPSERSLFRSLIDPFQKNYCAIADIMVTKQCGEVHEFAMTEDHPRESEKAKAILEKVRKRNKKYASIAQTKTSSASKRRGTRRWINNFKKTEKHPVSTELEKSSLLGELPARFVPCIHEGGGECDIDCKCRKNKTACEKFCTCSLNCANRFPGCRCTSTCDSKRCICFAASRECDPDLCFGCGAHELDISNMTCRNANIQRKMDKHLLWGPSDVSGWGIFLKFDVQKNEFISEYRGELVSQEEADRRGLVYDKVQHTFLFELNDHFVIDATRKGNKTRFANSSKTPNCFAKRMLVNGDHRIGIYAKRNIDSGEELFYDYENVLEKQAKTTSCTYTATSSQ